MRNLEVTVPDLAGRRRERMPYLPEDQGFEVVPDWVCEILSAATESKDREIELVARTTMPTATVVFRGSMPQPH